MLTTAIFFYQGNRTEFESFIAKMVLETFKVNKYSDGIFCFKLVY